jgi:hypothetical protein
MTNNDYNTWKNPDFPYIITDLTEINQGLKKWIIEKKQSVTLLGPAGSGKKLFVSRFLENHKDQFHNEKIDLEKEFEIDKFKRGEKSTIVTWENIDDVIESEPEKQESNFSSSNLKRKFQDLRELKNVIQIFLLRTINWKKSELLGSSLIKWLDNTTIHLTIGYDIDFLSEQLQERGKFISSDKLKFSSNFKVFQEAFSDSLRISEKSKIEILKTIVGPEFGPIFFSMKEELFKNPLIAKVKVCEDEISELLSYDDNFWESLLVLFKKLSQEDYQFSAIKISSKDELKSSFYKEGIAPREWLKNHIDIAQLKKIFEPQSDRLSSISDTEQFIDKIILDKK